MDVSTRSGLCSIRGDEVQCQLSHSPISCFRRHGWLPTPAMLCPSIQTHGRGRGRAKLAALAGTKRNSPVAAPSHGCVRPVRQPAAYVRLTLGKAELATNIVVTTGQTVQPLLSHHCSQRATRRQFHDTPCASEHPEDPAVQLSLLFLNAGMRSSIAKQWEMCGDRAKRQGSTVRQRARRNAMRSHVDSRPVNAGCVLIIPRAEKQAHILYSLEALSGPRV